MGIDDFSDAQISSRLEAMRNTGGTAEERAWAREFSGVIHRTPGESLAEAENQAWLRVIQSRFEETGG